MWQPEPTMLRCGRFISYNYIFEIFSKSLSVSTYDYLDLRVSVQALVFADANAIKENCVKLGAGEDLYPLFAGILTMRPWERVIDPAVDHLVMRGSEGDHSELQVIVK